ncbi:MAG: hypothetical protein IPG38_18835 [Chitinophagaceae bacterium]|nr:hypothetical protein [Chitinophagaceae bacterium]
MTKPVRLVVAAAMAITIHKTAASQSLSVNTDGSTADPSALLDVKSSAKGVLVPRMSKADKIAIATPATGLLIFQNAPDSIGFHYYDGTKWAWIQNSAAADTINWKTAGNTGLVDSSSFLGNIDNVPINFRINNQRVGKFNLNRLNYSIGRGAGNDLVSVGHVSIGDSAGSNINNNYPGVYIGYRSGVKNTATNNTFVGSWSGENTTTGASNAFFGTSSGIRNTTGYSNAFLGHFSGYYNTSGAGNTAVGTQALQSDTSGIANVAVGYQSMYLNRAGSYNTAVGIYSLYAHRRPFASYNTAIGTNSLEQDTTGYYNVGVGTSSLRFNSNSIGNTAIGTNAMYNHKINDYNTAVGFESMVSDTAGYLNTAMGWRSLR